MQSDTQQGDVVTSIRLPRHIHQRLREIAAAEHRSLTGEMRRLAELRIAEVDELETAA